MMMLRFIIPSSNINHYYIYIHPGVLVVVIVYYSVVVLLLLVKKGVVMNTNLILWGILRTSCL